MNERLQKIKKRLEENPFRDIGEQERDMKWLLHMIDKQNYLIDLQKELLTEHQLAQQQLKTKIQKLEEEIEKLNKESGSK